MQNKSLRPPFKSLRDAPRTNLALKAELEALETALAGKLGTIGGTLTGPLTGTTITATEFQMGVSGPKVVNNIGRFCFKRVTGELGYIECDTIFPTTIDTNGTVSFLSRTIKTFSAAPANPMEFSTTNREDSQLFKYRMF